jgi:hypothetical protein
MSAEVNPLAPKHLPIFITPPGGTDVLMVITAVLLLCAVVAVGIMFLRLHSLPRHIAAHRGQRMQANIVAVLCLIALFTQIWGFWIAALLLSLREFPDFDDLGVGRITLALERIAGIKSPPITSEPPSRRKLSRSHGSRNVPVPQAVELPAHLAGRGEEFTPQVDEHYA